MSQFKFLQLIIIKIVIIVLILTMLLQFIVLKNMYANSPKKF